MRRPRRQTLALPPRQPLRGEAKLRAALDVFGVDPRGKVALDVGAAAGGFTTALLGAGARLVYAVDAGHGQLLGSLRQDPRVVNLEATNVALLDTRLVPDSVELVTVDVSYLALAEAVRQLDRVGFATGAELVGLVKPMFELRLATAPVDLASVEAATRAAAEGVEHAGWQVLATIPSPVTGARGAREALLFAVRKPGLIPPTA
ncbi:MAG: TlyA family rRNA (cytidine-2'-O)-methyltransferase [Candidatus Dormibacteraeota bacterium]|nr:TlyA family rRNA (cytidine-2'-O)-methyltransferase [Candidatus Dormibacteraeota bacterium]